MCIEERLDRIDFRMNLVFENTPVTRLLYSYNISKQQYDRIMTLMDTYRSNIADKSIEKANHNIFEEDIYLIIPEHNGDYHFVEFLIAAFKEAGRWEEVCELLYGE